MFLDSYLQRLQLYSGSHAWKLANTNYTMLPLFLFFAIIIDYAWHYLKELEEVNTPAYFPTNGIWYF